MTLKISIAIAFLTGLGMIFIGARFMLASEIAEAGYAAIIVCTVAGIILLTSRTPNKAL